MGLAQDAVWWVWLGVHTWTGFGVRPRLMWGCCMAALCPGQCHGCGFLEGLCGSGGVGELTLKPAAAVAKHECTLLQISHPTAP